MLCLSGFELYSRWVPVKKESHALQEIAEYLKLLP